MATKPHATKKKTTAKAKRQPVKQEAPAAVAVVKKNNRRSMPKLIDVTKETLRTLRTERGLFGRLFLVTLLVSVFFFGATQQDQYVSTTNALDIYAKEIAGKGLDAPIHYGILLATAATGGLNTSLSGSQKVYFFFLYLLVWLVTVWLLRHRLAGTAVLVRDGFYNAGAPIVPILILFFIGTVQLMPMALGVILYSSAVTSGVLHGVLELGLFTVGALALTILSLYWLSGTVLAVMIATNQGSYPWKSLKAAKKVVTGRRTRLMLHLLWVTVLIVLAWAIVLVPAVVVDNWLHQPLVPVATLSTQILMSSSVIFASAYIYLLYRKMIDEPAD